MPTEEEAKTLWCPMAGEPRITRQSEDCLGSGCAAWRWLDDGKVRTYEDPNCDSWTKKSRMGNDLTITYYWEKDGPNRKGYCGLAGKPEAQS